MLTLCISVAVTLLDQLSKFFIHCRFILGDRRTVIPGLFDLSYVQNTGAAWGMLKGLSHWLVALSVVILVVLIVFRRRFIKNTWPYRAAMGLMIGGIAGNLIDRVKWGYVIDFLDFYWGRHHFPAFNLADSAICVGVGLYILAQRLDRPKPAPEGGRSAAAS
ncbi:MAG: signal peptidase II [Verrucomicrobiota bacterium]|nr:signal peptidase II [Verrucomicrobiota bacterium]